MMAGDGETPASAHDRTLNDVDPRPVMLGHVEVGRGKIIDSETEEIIRQIPSEEILKIASKMQEVIGVLFDKEY